MPTDSLANGYDLGLPAAQVFLIFDTDKIYQETIKVETQKDSFGDLVVYWTDIMHLHENAIYLKENNGAVATFVKNDSHETKGLRIEPERTLSASTRIRKNLYRSLFRINSAPVAPTDSADAHYYHQTTTTVTKKTRDSQLVKGLESLNETMPLPPTMHAPLPPASQMLSKLDVSTANSILEGRLLAECRKSMATSVIITPGFKSAAINKFHELHNQGHNLQEIAQQVLNNAQETTDRVSLIQSRTEAILTQQLDLTEYPIPRLFIALPEETAMHGSRNWFRTKFRLHFICECGTHTKASGGMVPNHFHLAKHEGYLICQPTEFFKKYGPFLLLMLELIKVGTSIAGHTVPALASLKSVGFIDSVQQNVESVTAQIDYSLECIDKQLTKIRASSSEDFVDTEPRTAVTQQDLTNYLSNVEGLKGAELRQLRSFLKTSEEENLLGNLYRMTTSDGHVKWVCYDHYRASNQEQHAQKIHDVVNQARGKFDEQLGRIRITLTSSSTANEFYNTLSNSKGVIELVVDLEWRCTESDLGELRDTLKKSSVQVLRLDFGEFGAGLVGRSLRKLLSPSARYQVLSQILELPNMKVIHIVLPKDFHMLSNFHPKRPSRLRKLSFELAAKSFRGMELGLLAEALKTNSTLTKLDLWDNSIRDNGAQALSEALKINSTLTTLNLRNNSIGDNGAQAL
ncbi:hypothetical protein BGZ98_002110, partial [Dissophora globulifera]